MKIKEVEEALIDFCAKEGIHPVRGCVSKQDQEKIEIFLDVLKVSTKNRAKFLRKEPQAIKDILNKMGYKNERL